MQLDVSSLGEKLVRVTLKGRLDAQGVDRIETQFIAAIVPDGNSAIVDFSGVEFMASMGVRMLISTARSMKFRQAKMAVYGAPTPIALVFEAVSLQKIIPVCATEAQALAAVGAPSA